MSKKPRFNARKRYFENLGIEPVPGFDVHHIDHNSENNEMINLVAIPSKLHRDYHQSDLMNYPKESLILDIMPDKTSFSGGFNDLRRIHKDLGRFVPIYEQICRWIAYRDHLLTGLPNMYSLSYTEQFAAV